MKLFVALLLAQGAFTFALTDFGKVDSLTKQQNHLRVEKNVFDEAESFLEIERYLNEMSMSTSMSYSTNLEDDGSNDTGSGSGSSGGGGSSAGSAGGGSGGNSGGSGSNSGGFGSNSGGSGSNSGGSGSNSGGFGGNSGGNNFGSGGNTDGTLETSAPTSDQPTLSPSMAPTVTTMPSANPSNQPSKSPSVSPFPTSSPAPTTPPAPFVGLFECSDQGAVAAGNPVDVTTPLSLSVFYEAESTANTTEGFLNDLEVALFSIALEAALDCDGSRRRRLMNVHRKLTATSSIAGSCNATESVDNSCFSLQTDMAFELNKDVDPDYAAYLAYSALQSAMGNYTGDGIDTVVRLTYVAPTPTMPANGSVPSTRSKSIFSPLAIGACAAMFVGGTLAAYVWVHNRRSRNKRHVELTEDQSQSPVSLFSAERDPYDEA